MCHFFHLVVQDLDLVLVQSVLTVVGLHGGAGALHLSVEDADDVLECANFELQLLAAPAQLCHLGLFALELQFQGSTHGAGQRGERGGQGRGARTLHGSCTTATQLAHLLLQVPEGLVEFLQLVAGYLQALGLQALQAHLDAHDEMQEQVEVFIGTLPLMVMNLLFLHLGVKERYKQKHIKNSEIRFLIHYIHTSRNFILMMCVKLFHRRRK